MKIKYFDKVSSTHTKLQDYINQYGYTKPLCFVTNEQTNGIGSRNNKWENQKGNLFFSFVVDKKLLPKDLQIQSSSIYFSFILKEILSSLGSNVFIKWPNDFYIDDKKIGGTITTLKNDLLYCGIGLNLIKVSNCFGHLDIVIGNIDDFLNEYFKALEIYPSWKQIISKFEIEYYQTNVAFKANNISLKNSVLQKDGSLLINGKKVFSLR